MKFLGKHPSVHVLKKEENKQKQSGSCMLRSSKSDSTCCTVVHLNSAKIWFDISKNEWNHLNIQMSENLIPCSNDSPISFNHSIFSTHGQQQRFFPSPDSLAVLLARIANPALQSAWQECHLFPKGSVMSIRRLLNFLLALINALFLHCWRPVFHLSRHQVWCSNAANVSTGVLDHESSNE